MSFWETKKKHLIAAASILASVFTIYTGIIFIDERYVQAADFAAQVEKQEKALKQFRIQELENKLFELEFKVQTGTDTPLDRALRERYKQQLDRLQ